MVHAPVLLEEIEEEGNPYVAPQETVIDNDKQIPDINLIENNFDKDTVAQTDFTSNNQFKSAQSNIANDIAGLVLDASTAFLIRRSGSTSSGV